MKAFIFNSGVGSRLGDLTKDRPKGLVELPSGETILGRQLKLLIRCGIKDVVISTGYLEQTIINYCNTYFPNINFTFVHNPIYASTNSIYSLFLAKKHINDDFLVMHGDLVFDEGILWKLLKSKEKDVACINRSIPKPPKDFKGRIEGNKLLRISVDINDENDFALQPLYKFSHETLNKWFVEISKFVEQGNIKVYAENALNEILPSLDVKVVNYSRNFLEEIDNMDDYHRVGDAIRTFDFNHQLVIKGDYVKGLNKLFKIYGFKKPFIVYSRAAFKNLEFGMFVKKYNAKLFKGYSPNPKYEEVLEGLKLFKEESCDVIIAIGGGSCLDTAKAIKSFSMFENNFLSQKPLFVPLPLIAVPTTAGTGSEATRYSVIYDKGEKQSLAHDSIFPDFALLDPTFLEELPIYHRKASLLDAFCQAIESYWAKNSTLLSKKYSRKALKLFLSNYQQYLLGNKEVNGQIMNVSYLAGQAINISATTAPHAMSYKLTTLTGVAHGHAVSATLPQVLKFMIESKSLSKKYLARIKQLAKMFKTDIEHLSIIIGNIVNEFNLDKPSVSLLHLDELVNDVNMERLMNNPIMLTKSDIRNIYLKSTKLD